MLIFFLFFLLFLSVKLLLFLELMLFFVLKKCLRKIDNLILINNKKLKLNIVLCCIDIFLMFFLLGLLFVFLVLFLDNSFVVLVDDRCDMFLDIYKF